MQCSNQNSYPICSAVFWLSPAQMLHNLMTLIHPNKHWISLIHFSWMPPINVLAFGVSPTTSASRKSKPGCCKSEQTGELGDVLKQMQICEMRHKDKNWEGLTPATAIGIRSSHPTCYMAWILWLRINRPSVGHILAWASQVQGHTSSWNLSRSIRFLSASWSGKSGAWAARAELHDSPWTKKPQLQLNIQCRSWGNRGHKDLLWKETSVSKFETLPWAGQSLCKARHNLDLAETYLLLLCQLDLKLSPICSRHFY